MTLRLAETTRQDWRRFLVAPEKLPPEVASALDEGRPIVLTSRYSSPTGATARSSAINTLRETAALFGRQAGLDLGGMLPSSEDLDLRLDHATRTRSERLSGGRDIEHRFVTIDLRPHAPVILFLATGTGRIAASDFTQPFVQRLAGLVNDQSASVVVAKRWDRLTRNDLLVGPLLLAMMLNDTWVCTDKRFGVVNEITQLLLQVDSIAAGANTLGEDRAKRLGQADRTGRALVNGQVAYHLPSPPPPGTGVVTLRRRPGVEREKVLYLDTPGCRPKAQRVADGLSEVTDESGDVVDQVANVRWFLARYGDPKWMDGTQLHDGLVERHFSTVHVRRMNGADVSVTSSVGHTAWRTILDNIDAYENGVLHRSPGGDVDDVAIMGFLPPDGLWATAEDFARVRAWMGAAKERVGRKTQLSLAGLSATYDGQLCRTRSRAQPTSSGDGEPCLQFLKPPDGGHETHVADHVLLPHRTFAESIADAIIAAGSTALLPLVEAAAHAEDAEHSKHEVKLAELQRQEVELAQTSQAIVSQLGETDDLGRPLLTGGILAAASKRFDTIEADLGDIRRRIELSRAQVSAAAPQSHTALDVSMLPRLLMSLRDPADLTYRDLWKRIIGQLRFATSPGQHPGKTSRCIEWTGVIKLDVGDGGTVVIPFSGKYEYRRIKPGQGPRHRDRSERFVHAMLAGTPYVEVDELGRIVNRPRVAAALGIDDGHPIFSCDQPMIVALATALLARAKGRGEPLPKVPKDIVAAIAAVHVEDRSARPWRTARHGLDVAFYDLAADSGRVTVSEIMEACSTTRGTVHSAFNVLKKEDQNWTSERKRGYVLAACSHCDGRDRRPAEIPEIEGLLCACGRDEAGVTWPHEFVRDYRLPRRLA
jgi:hypothetical protein